MEAGLDRSGIHVTTAEDQVELFENEPRRNVPIDRVILDNNLRIEQQRGGGGDRR